MEFRLLSPELSLSSRAEDYEADEEENLELPSSPLFEITEQGVGVLDHHDDFSKNEFDVCLIGVFGAGSQFVKGALVERVDELKLVHVASIRSQEDAHTSKKVKRSKDEIVDKLYLYSDHGMKVLIIDSGSVIEQKHNAQYCTVSENHQKAYTTYLYSQLLIEKVKAKRFVILDSILASSFTIADRRNARPPLLRCLRTTADRKLTSLFLPPNLESPNLMTGLSGTIFSMLENRGLNGVLLCSLEENHGLEQVTMKAFETPVFALLVKEHSSTMQVPLSPLSPNSLVKYKTHKSSVEHQSLYL